MSDILNSYQLVSINTAKRNSNIFKLFIIYTTFLLFKVILFDLFVYLFCEMFSVPLKIFRRHHYR